jgi:diguanylate cyclase (GGDEF)-like protein/PAS domain S-box-containing protein
MMASSRMTDLARLNERLGIALRAGGIGVWEYNFAMGRFEWDEQMHRLHGLQPGQFDGTMAAWSSHVHADDMARVTGAWRRALAGRTPFECDFRICRPDGEVRHLRTQGEVMRDPDGTALRAAGASWDVTERERLARRFAEERERLRITLNSIGDAVICTDMAALVTFVNPTAERLTGWPAGEANGRPLDEVMHLVEQESGRSADNPANHCLRSAGTVTRETGIFLASRTGAAYDIGFSAAPIRAADGSFAGSVIIFNDVTELRESEKMIAHSARRDALTGLPNRTTFISKLNEALAEAREGKRIHVLCFIDLDRFKAVNDTGGHAAGDALLNEIAKLLALTCSGRDMPARLGGDEFALLLRDCSIWNAEAIAQQLIASISNLNFVWHEHVFRIGASIGATAIGRDAPDLNEVLHQADKACYAAKQAGRNCFRAFAQSKAQPDAEAEPERHLPPADLRLH